MELSKEDVFTDLPAALVDKLLQDGERIGETISEQLKALQAHREVLRRALHEQGLLRNVAELPIVDVPTVCGIDGSYGAERLVAVDIVGFAALGVEGLTPPSEKREWPEPHFASKVWAEPHREETTLLLRACMVGWELTLAAQAPHEVVLLDGSLTTPLIYLNQALSRIDSAATSPIHTYLKEHLKDFLSSYQQILMAARSDRQYAALPKYSSRREICRRLTETVQTNLEDKAILNLLLSAGEYTQPVPLEQPSSPWHLSLPPEWENAELVELRDSIVEILSKEVRVIYYRPMPWIPPLRIEVSRAVAENKARRASLLRGLQEQCRANGMLEPYPLFLADKMVKHFPEALGIIRQIATRHAALQHPEDASLFFLALHHYRTET
ncbi:MAG: DNA double-strand break repair nuclease NurA [Bacteroidia bacterium]|nr:DNA double-strand break repair nuclease NurA [Bacteroidia bacterium]